MKKTIMTMIMVLAAMMMSAQSPVENTPFKEAVDKYNDGVNQVWEYVQSIGYNVNCNIHNDTTVYGTDGAYNVIRVYAAYNPTDKSVVVLIADIWDYDYTHRTPPVEHLKWVNFQWTDKKLMPKGLPKVKDERRINKYTNKWDGYITQGRYKNNYLMSTIGNQWKPRGGFNVLRTFSGIINGEYVSGSWIE